MGVSQNIRDDGYKDICYFGTYADWNMLWNASDFLWWILSKLLSTTNLWIYGLWRSLKSPVVMIPNPTVEEPMMRSIVYQARPGQDPQRFFAKRSAPDMNPDFDHFSANRGKRFAGNMDSDFDHFSGFYQMAKRSAPDMNPDFDHFSANRGKRSAGDMGPNFDDFGATRG